MRRLLNISTHPGDLEIFGNDWSRAEELLERWGFDGFELYPVGDYPFERIPSRLVTGLHLRFFVILEPIWRQNSRRLLEIFGNWQTVEKFYGGCSPGWISRYYSHQLDLAQLLECDYVVFHPVHCELEYIWDWNFPWHWRRILDLCAEVINAAIAGSGFTGWVLFENLWWPGSFRLDSSEEYHYLQQKVISRRCGITLDTGHLLNRNHELAGEAQAVAYLLDCLDQLNELIDQIRTVHLTKSLSGDYIRSSRLRPRSEAAQGDFWQRLDHARRHVGLIDRHEAFSDPGIVTFLEKASPRNVVFEFAYRNLAQWEQKIAIQKKATSALLWPGNRES